MKIEWSALSGSVTAPAYAHAGDAGADLVSACDVHLEPGERALVPTGVAVAIPGGYVGLVTPRSGLAARLGLGMVNAPGVIDAGYRGELKVNLVNHDPSAPIDLAAGDRIAQLLVVPVVRAEFVHVDSLDTTDRGAHGHGSTGGAAALESS